MGLAEDIARVAALRGKPAEAFHTAELARRQVPAETIETIFKRNGWPDDEMAAFDTLPIGLRRAICSLPQCASAVQCRFLLAQFDEETLIAAMEGAFRGSGR